MRWTSIEKLCEKISNAFAFPTCPQHFYNRITVSSKHVSTYILKALFPAFSAMVLTITDPSQLSEKSNLPNHIPESLSRTLK